MSAELHTRLLQLHAVLRKTVEKLSSQAESRASAASEMWCRKYFSAQLHKLTAAYNVPTAYGECSAGF